MKEAHVFLDLWELLPYPSQLAESTADGSSIFPHSEGSLVPQLLSAQGKAKEK